MATETRTLPERSLVPVNWGFLAVVLATAFGLQALRAFFPLLVYVLKDRFGVSSPALGAIAFGLFGAGFLVPRLTRGPAGFRGALLGLIAARGALQIWKGDPAVSLALAAASVVAFLAFLSTLSADRVLPFLMGAVLDVSLHALFGTRDLHWGGGRADFVAGGLVGIAACAALLARRPEAESPAPAPLGTLAWGPFLFLELELLGNVARLSARTALPTCFSGEIVAGGLALTALLAPRLARLRIERALPFLATAILAEAVLRAETLGLAAVPFLVLAQLAAAVLLVAALEPRGVRPRLGPASAAMGGGAVLLVALLFLHYAGYDLPLPEGRVTGKLIAAGLLLVAAARFRGATPAPAPSLCTAASAFALTILPLVRGIPTTPPQLHDPNVAEIVTFNVHAGFDERGGWGFDRMMRELHASNPDVVALQEVSRGWVINGCADLYELAREQLGLTGTPAPTVTSDWGNAVFVRGDVAGTHFLRLPPRSLRLTRAAVAVERPSVWGLPREVVATHLHHRTPDDAIRADQARALVAAFPVRPDAVLLADFNAQPDSPCFTVLRQAGWLDAAGPPEVARTAPTFPAKGPVRRIDTIFVGDFSRVLSCGVAPPWGSDHRAVIVRWAIPDFHGMVVREGYR